MSAADPQDKAVPQPKEDPESLVLRGRPRPAVRFRRGLIIGLAGAVAAGVVGVTWFALDPPTFRLVAEEASPEPRERDTPDVLAAAPAGYGDVPRLGPPLPGDLGRPILERQRQLAAEQPAPAADRIERSPAESALEAERQRLMAAERAAREAGVLVPLSSTGRGPRPPSSAEAQAAVNPSRMSTAAPPQAQVDPAPNRLMAAASPWTLTAGTVIPASLVTGIDSDLPGIVVAQVTEHVRDSRTGRTVLIPQGSRLIGSYDSQVAFAQRRALLVWERIVLPDGSSLALDKLPGTDPQGYSGVRDRVDTHSWQLAKGVVLATLLGVGTELSLGSKEGELVRAVRESTQQNVARAGDQLTQRNLDIKPTLRIRPGWPVRAIVGADLVLQPWRGEGE